MDAPDIEENSPVNQRSTILEHAGGKVILFGEHAVLYGAPAYACSLPEGVTVAFTPGESRSWIVNDVPVDLQRDDALCRGLAVAEAHLGAGGIGTWTVSTGIPPAMGLGWSAAVSWAVGKVAARVLGVEAMAFAHAMEGAFHGRASGVDLAAVSHRTVIKFRLTPDGPTIDDLGFRPPGTYLLAGTKPALTCEMVAGFRERYEADPPRYERHLDRLRALAPEVEVALREGDRARLGAGFTAAHEVLRELGVSSPVLDRLVEIALDHGAYGAKLTGKGGGGCILVLAPEERGAAIRDALAPTASFVRTVRFHGDPSGSPSWKG